MLRKEDFNNDKVDAGEIGAGHTVTALYEVVPVGAAINPACLRSGRSTQVFVQRKIDFSTIAIFERDAHGEVALQETGWGPKRIAGKCRHRYVHKI